MAAYPDPPPPVVSLPESLAAQAAYCEDPLPGSGSGPECFQACHGPSSPRVRGPQRPHVKVLAAHTNSHVSKENARRLMSNLKTVLNAMGTPHVGARAQVAICGRGREAGRERGREGEREGRRGEGNQKEGLRWCQ